MTLPAIAATRAASCAPYPYKPNTPARGFLGFLGTPARVTPCAIGTEWGCRATGAGGIERRAVLRPPWWGAPCRQTCARVYRNRWNT